MSRHSRPGRGDALRFALTATLALRIVIAAENACAEQVKETHALLGATLEITVESPDLETGQNRIRDAIAVARTLEAELTPGIDTNEVGKLNVNAGLGPRAVPLDLYRLLALSQIMTRSTGDAFDVTVGPLLRLSRSAAKDPVARRDEGLVEQPSTGEPVDQRASAPRGQIAGERPDDHADSSSAHSSEQPAGRRGAPRFNEEENDSTFLNGEPSTETGSDFPDQQAARRLDQQQSRGAEAAPFSLQPDRARPQPPRLTPPPEQSDPHTERSASQPGRLTMDEALSLVGADKIVLHPPNRVELPHAGMSVDFSAIVRGYVLERMASALRAAGTTTALLAFADTTILAVGPPASEPPLRAWVPRGRSMVGSVALRDMALSTSRAHRRSDDPRPPIVDPRSGRFVESDRQATVVARNAAIAEAWSTALVVDPDGALVLLDEPRDVEAVVFDEHGEHASPRFMEYVDWKPARQPGETLSEQKLAELRR